MLKAIVRKVIGSKNERELRRIHPIVGEINALERKTEALSDADLLAKTAEFKARIARGEPLDALLPEAFAVVREASKRTLRQRHFDVQLIGGVVLHEGKIAEMKTGEGKTLAATLPVYLNALLGRGAQVVTVNDYLARRDADWMGAIYRFLGLSVGVIVHGLTDQERQRAYRSDITYGTNNEFGFDYLRDNMKYHRAEFVQRDPYYAIVDEVDSILIDEARTPLIISGPTEESTDKYYRINRVIPQLVKPDLSQMAKLHERNDPELRSELEKKYDYIVDEKAHTATLTDRGVAHVEKLLSVPNLYEPSQMETLHHVNQGLRAHALFHRDVEYVVKDGGVAIVDEFTGRLMPGRRWSDGLHQAVEAKENVRIENENQTLASVTFQNYFRMYEKLAGMTGTADTEAPEFHKTYNLDVVVIPTNEPMIREDRGDVIYRTEREKFDAVIEEIKDCHERGQPVLVGTISIEKSEKLARLLKKQGIAHHVLNAKHHAHEAEIVAQAGRKGAVVISTNMAGRGTDIVLGGTAAFLARAEADEESAPEAYQTALRRYRAHCSEEREQVIAAGGLHIIGTERHESRRIDNQLRGRSGRQGDPGSSRFYLSLEDDLMRIFGSDRISPIMERLGMEEGEPIEHRLVTRAIENAQKKVEARNFDIRKHLLEYDDVMNKQREVIYSQRRRILESDELTEEVLGLARESIEEAVFEFAPEKTPPAEWDYEGIRSALIDQFGIDADVSAEVLQDGDREALIASIFEQVKKFYEGKQARCKELSIEHAHLNYRDFSFFEKGFFLESVDSAWKDHLLQMDHLKEGIGLRGYGQRDPLREYQREGYETFVEMNRRIRGDVLKKIFKFQLPDPERIEEMIMRRPARSRPITLGRGGGASEPPPAKTTVKRSGRKVGRNEPCPCGSGKKFKRCHGA